MPKTLRAAFLLLLMTVGHAISANTEAQLILTSKINGFEPEESFSCEGFIHGYLVLPQTAVGGHLLEGIWIQPNGQVNNHAKIPIDFAPPGHQTAYVWFQFQDKAGGLLSGNREAEDGGQNPNQLYNGKWQVQVRWDNQVLTQKSFNVKC